jgi:hypothetical protein
MRLVQRSRREQVLVAHVLVQRDVQLSAPLEQSALASALTENMNEHMTSWVITGPFELAPLIDRVVAALPLLSDSIARADGFAHSESANTDWICQDGEHGSGVYLFPRNSNLFNEKMHKAVIGLKPGLTVQPGIYGDVDPIIWNYLAGAGIVPAQEFLASRG